MARFVARGLSLRIRQHLPVRYSRRCRSSSNEPLIVAAVLGALAASVPAQRQFAELGAPTFANRIEETNAVALGDVDGDGDLDVVFGNYFENRLYLNDGFGSYSDVSRAWLPDHREVTHAVAFGDVDGDGDLDLVIGNYKYSELNRLYMNNGHDRFVDVTDTHMPTVLDRTYAVELGDVDGDGDLDMVVANSGFGGSQRNRLHVNDGTGVFTDVTDLQLPSPGYWTHAVALGDVDGDGDLDIVFGNGIFGQPNLLYLNDGAGTFRDVTGTQLPASAEATYGVALGDVDGDGDLDIAFANNSYYPYNTGQNELYLNDGTGNYTDVTGDRMPAYRDGTKAVVMGDIEGDGDLDLVFANDVLDRNRLCVNDGGGTYIEATVERLPVGRGRSRDVGLADVDGDGDLDIVFGRPFGSESNSLYLNLLRQLVTPLPLRIGETFRVDAYARFGPASLMDVAIPFISTGTAAIPLPPLGHVGLDPTRLLALPPFSISKQSGKGSLSFGVRNEPGIVGLTVYAQAVIVQDPFPAYLTNVVGDLIVQ